MPLSRAEIQRRYRERKKRDCDTYLIDERTRQRTYYVPSGRLTPEKRKQRNAYMHTHLTKHRLKKKMGKHQNQPDENTEHQSDTGYDTVASDNPRLVVRLPLTKRFGPRRRLTRALKNANDKLRLAAAKNIQLTRKLKTLQRNVLRQTKQKRNPQTPKSKTESQLKNAGICKHQASQIRKKLFLGNVVISEMKEASKQKTKKQHVYSTVAGAIIEKYKCITKLSKEIEINRNKLSKVIKQGINMSKKHRRRVRAKERESVISFLEREDNCRLQPGKKDATKIGKEKIQTRILTDYMGNLYQKYLAENSDSKISLATFCRIRPKYIRTTGFLGRNVCLCTKHQNIAMKLQMLRKEGIDVPQNPETFLKSKVTIDKSQIPENVEYPKWKRVTLENNKKKMKIVNEVTDRDSFYDLWEKEFEQFNEHYFTMKTQYQQTRALKENLPEHEIAVHMYFAENYSCKSADEIQSAYWNTSQVTVHPLVVYYRKSEETSLSHKSFVAVSDELGHSASTVLAITQKFLREIDLPGCDEVQYVHYWTDSPTSQYRNRYIFNDIANHEERHGCPATWNYYEAGHGKNVCDGLGGSVKRYADEAVRAGKVIIQDAEDFMKWAQGSNMKVSFFFVEKEECQTMAEELQTVQFSPVKGTLKIHSVKLNEHAELCTSSTSCYCEICISGKSCVSWTTPTTSREPRRQAITNNDIPAEASMYGVDEYVATVYDGNWFVGQVTDVDDDGEIEISFMEKRKAMYQWPAREDILWVNQKEVLCRVEQPKPSGKSGRMFKITELEQMLIESLYHNRV